MSSKNITYGPSEQELIPAGVTQLFFPILWFIIHSITSYMNCHFSLNVFDKRALVLPGQVLLFTNIMYQPPQMPAAAAELSLKIRVSAGLFPATHWSHEHEEQPMGTHLSTPSLCQVGHTHVHAWYYSRRLQREENCHALHNTAHQKDSELPLLPADPATRSHSHRSVDVTADGSASTLSCVHSWDLPQPTSLGLSRSLSMAVSAALPWAWYWERCALAAQRPAMRAGLRTCPSHAPCLQDQFSEAQQRQEALFALLASS